MLATIGQVILVLILYGGGLALIVEYVWKSIQDRGRPNPVGDLMKDDDLPDA